MKLGHFALRLPPSWDKRRRILIDWHIGRFCQPKLDGMDFAPGAGFQGSGERQLVTAN